VEGERRESGEGVVRDATFKRDFVVGRGEKFSWDFNAYERN
jgi:hypothetical protein